MKKILVIQQKMIGDVLTSTVLFDALKQVHPDWQLHYLINSGTLPVVENHPSIDKFIVLTPETEKSYSKFYSFLKAIKKSKYDAVIDVYGKLGSNLISYFSHAPIKIAYHKKEKTFLYTHNIKRISKPQHAASLAIENRMLLLEPLGVSFKDLKPKIHLLPSEIDRAKENLKTSDINTERPLFMISVLGSNPTKSYPSEFMAKLLDFIVEQKPQAQLIFNYIPNQQKEAEAIFAKTTAQTQRHIFFDFYIENLRDLLAIVQSCDAVIGNEGGLINMAKALKVPTFVIFSPYLKKENWFGTSENETHTAVHLSDFVDYKNGYYEKAKQNPHDFYRQFEPKFIEPRLKVFLNEIA